jgi:hypothetical protein
MDEFFQADLDYFTNYGEPFTDLNIEIQNDLRGFILNAVRSQPFDRAKGIGLEQLENENTNPVIEILIKTFFVEQIFKRYNAVVPSIKRVITSTELISVERKDEALYINVQYFNEKDVNTPAQELQSVTVGV